jgi:hypothetical protein
MSNKRKSFYSIVVLMLLLAGICGAFIGCSSQESTQADPAQKSNEAQQPSNAQPPEGIERPDGMEPPEGIQPPEGGERPEGMPPGGGGFNFSDEEFEELLTTAVEEGTITAEQVDEILAWWALRPEFNSEEPDEDQMEEMEEMNEWMQQQPESAKVILFGGRGGPPGGGGPPPEQES